jgi:MYXO-CTERM domain-containing protein
LSSETAYLFTKFATGELDGYVYTDGSDRSASAEALQRVIWYFEGEIDASEINDGLDSTQQTLAAGWKSDAETVVSEGDWVGIGLVRVIQMAQPPGSTSPDQDQLVLVSAPAAAVLGLLGVGGFAALRRRFR